MRSREDEIQFVSRLELEIERVVKNGNTQY